MPEISNPYSHTSPTQKAIPPFPAIVTVFSGDGLRGTRAAVYQCAQRPLMGPMAETSLQRLEEACCFLWPADGRVQLLCFNNGVAVSFCGHGLLAGASLWEANYSLPGQIDSNGVTYGIFRGQDDHLWLRAPRITTTGVSLGKQQARWFDVPPTACAIAGDENGYWIFQWPDGFDLASLAVDLEAIRRHTKRAVIATCATGAGASDLVLSRYFAPQYGKDEDAVTGSAAVVLGDYWGARSLSIIQCSPQGGRMEVRVDDRHVTIGGRVHINGNNLRDSTTELCSKVT